MARPDDEDAPWTRQLLVGVGALVAVALVIGGVVSVVALGAARVSGIDSAKGGSTAPPSLVIPSGEPTPAPEPYAGQDVPQGSPTPKVTSSPSASPTSKPKKKPRTISLQVFPDHVGSNGRINLTGVYKREGARLQVQRFDGSWQDFPVSTSVSGGQFSTYVFSGRTGMNRFRVVDTGNGKASNAVRVRIG